MTKDLFQLLIKHSKKTIDPAMPNTCHSCGGKHFKSNCFFKNKKCYECNRVGHKATHCKYKKKKKKRKNKKNVCEHGRYMV